jgi:hypothetical protein
MVTDDGLAHEVECLTGSEQGRPTSKAIAASVARHIRQQIGQNLVGGGEVLKAVIAQAGRQLIPTAVTCLAVWLQDYLAAHKHDEDEPAARQIGRMNSTEMVSLLAYLAASGASVAVEEAIQSHLRRRYRRVLGVEDEFNGHS